KRKTQAGSSLKDVSVVKAQSVFSNDATIQRADDSIRDVVSGSAGIAREQYQMLRAELSAHRQRGMRSLIVTSAVPDEGKTFVACCLSTILAKQRDIKVVLIDGDLRTRSAGHALGIEKERSHVGLTNVLKGSADIENCLIPFGDLNLWFLPA